MTILALTLALPARAHDRYEIWTIAVVRPAYLEVAVTMAAGTALQLVDPGATLPAVTPENFASLRAHFERAAAGLLVLTANRKPLRFTRVEVELTEESDVVFRFAYPRPTPGRLHVHAALFKKLGAGYGGILEISDTDGNHLGWEQLSPDNPNLEVAIPASAAPDKPRS